MSQIAKVVVEIALDREFDYLIPAHLADSVVIGSQVVIPFGHRKIYGYVIGLAAQSARADLKPIIDLAAPKPLITDRILELAKWMADYYATPLEQVLKTILPSPVRSRKAKHKEQRLVRVIADQAMAVDLDRLKRRSPKQAAVLDFLRTHGQAAMPVLTRDLGATTAMIRSMEKKGWVGVDSENVDRNPFQNQQVLPTQPFALMPQQQDALDTIKKAVDTGDPSVVLLFGVTGSGKTEVYLQALQYVRQQGKGAIILVPEISLTPQTVERFRSRFAEGIAVLHSHLSIGERHDEWHRIRDGRAQIAIGARSALFAPIENLGLIIVDEEHEHTYKQEEAPRYHARDMAVVRGRMERCPVILGSATPSLESYCNVLRGKYTMSRLPHRVDHRQMPVLRIVDMRADKEKEGRVNVLSQILREAIQLRLDRGEQTILFLNRRGYSTSLVCPSCGYVAQCEHCSVAMTYHKKADELRCHICGSTRKVPARCPESACGDPAFRFAGVGTQKVEDIVSRVFPRAQVERMDSDTMTRKDSYGRILGDFRSGKIDILLGTQMIAKGLDYPNVTLVGVINADTTLHMPDFRASERAFQLLTQVAGRAGRGDVAGEVIVQTFTPFHPSIQAARRLDYDGFYDQEIAYRKELSYPPFSHLVCLTVRGPVEQAVSYAADQLISKLKPALSNQVMVGGPSPAPLARIKGLYRYQIMFRAPTTARITSALKPLLRSFKWPPKVHCAVDIDALSIL